MKAFIKPFEVPQRSAKIKIISTQLSEMHGTGRVNMHYLLICLTMKKIQQTHENNNKQHEIKINKKSKEKENWKIIIIIKKR